MTSLPKLLQGNKTYVLVEYDRWRQRGLPITCRSDARWRVCVLLGFFVTDWRGLASCWADGCPSSTSRQDVARPVLTVAGMFGMSYMCGAVVRY
jgi:hypothetical protein